MRRWSASFVFIPVLVIGLGCQVSEETSPSLGESLVVAAEATEDRDELLGLSVRFVPSPHAVVDKMMEMAQVTADDVVYDLGCGDGRIPIAAAKLGARAVCVDLDPIRIEEAMANAEAEGVQDMITFRQEDLFDVDVSDATVVTLYLLPELNLRLRPRLTEQLESGSRIVSHSFDMGDWEPEEMETVSGSRRVYLWHTDGTVRP